VVAAIDEGTEVTRILQQSGAGISVPPDTQSEFARAIASFVADPAKAEQCGASGRKWVETHVSPAVVAHSYLEVIAMLGN
jgi:colanic acid biosynthesis glycosyl transferase WcaI